MMGSAYYPDFDPAKEYSGTFQVIDADVAKDDEEYCRLREDQIAENIPPEFQHGVVRKFSPLELGDNHLFYSTFSWRYIPSLEHKDIKEHFRVRGVRMIDLGFAAKSLALKEFPGNIEYKDTVVGRLKRFKMNPNMALCLLWRRCPGALLGYAMAERNRDRDGQQGWIYLAALKLRPPQPLDCYQSGTP